MLGVGILTQFHCIYDLIAKSLPTFINNYHFILLYMYAECMCHVDFWKSLRNTYFDNDSTAAIKAT